MTFDHLRIRRLAGDSFLVVTGDDPYKPEAERGFTGAADLLAWLTAELGSPGAIPSGPYYRPGIALPRDPLAAALEDPPESAARSTGNGMDRRVEPDDDGAARGEEARRADREQTKGEEARRADREAARAEEGRRPDRDQTRAEEGHRPDREQTRGGEGRRADREQTRAEEARRADREQTRGEEARRADRETTRAEEGRRPDRDQTRAEVPRPVSEERAEELLGHLREIGAGERWVKLTGVEIGRVIGAAAHAQISPVVSLLVRDHGLRKARDRFGHNWFTFASGEFDETASAPMPAQTPVPTPASSPVLTPVLTPVPAERALENLRGVLAGIARRLGTGQFEVTAERLAEKAEIFAGAVPRLLAELGRRGELTLRPSPAGGMVITLDEQQEAARAAGRSGNKQEAGRPEGPTGNKQEAATAEGRSGNKQEAGRPEGPTEKQQ